MNDKYTDYIFKCDKTGLKIIRPDINLDTVKDGRGYVSTYFPEDDIKEFNIVYFHSSMIRGFHFHPHFVEYSLVASGEGMFVYRTDADDPSSDKTFILSKGMCVRVPIGVVHTIYSITDLTVIASLSKKWDDCDPPIVQIGDVPKPNNVYK
jgi:mannose-6-phosphate isomerase-like protein (cupin superfamily)